jgi:cathepsin D
MSTLAATVLLCSLDAAHAAVAVNGAMIRMPLLQREPQARPAPSFLQLAPPVAAESPPPVVDIYGKVTLGGKQTFTVALDTGSGNVLLTSSTCRSLGCMSHKAYDAQLSQQAARLELSSSADEEAIREVVVGIATGQAEGMLTEDDMCLGDESLGACARTGFIEMTKMSPEPWDKFPYDGIMGLGLPSASIDKRFNFLGNLAEAGILKRNRFAIWLAGDFDAEPSEVTFGDFPESRLGSEILWMPVVEPQVGQWRVEMRDVTMRGSKLGLCGVGCRAVFDTGTAVIGGPTSLISGILAGLNIREDCSNYDSLPPLGFVFRMFTFNIEKQDYVKKDGEKCYHQFLILDAPPPKGPAMFLGSPFLKRYFTIFDRESLKVGVALSNHKPNPSTGESAQDEAMRLIVPTE